MTLPTFGSPAFLVSDGYGHGGPALPVPQEHDLIALADGGFAVAWKSGLSNAPVPQGVLLQTFGPDGAAETGQVPVALFGAGIDKDDVALTQLDGGSIVVAWSQHNADFTNNREDVWYRLFATDGAALGAAAMANQALPDQQEDPALVARDGGDWRMAWTSFGQDGGFDGIFGRDFAPSGAPLDDEAMLAPDPAGYQNRVALARLADGSQATAFFDGSTGGFVRLLTDAGAATIDAGLAVTTAPELAALAGGGVAVAFSGSTGESGFGAMRLGLQVVEADGTQRPPVLIEGSDARRLEDFAITGTADGGFAAVWQVTVVDDGRVTGYEIALQRFDAHGVAVTAPQTLPSPLPYNRSPEITTLIDGDIMVTWQAKSTFGNPNVEEGLLGLQLNPLVFGTANGEVLTDTLGQDYIEGRGGNDLLLGLSGDDLLFGNAGADTIYGGPGSDTTDGGEGDDLLGGGPGADSLYGGAGFGADALWGATGDDTLGGGAGNDTLGGAAGDDLLRGGGGDDALWGSQGDDTLSGGTGVDMLGGASGNDSIEGDAGDDELWGASGSDTLLGGADDDQVGGGISNDRVEGGSGRDSLYGGLGNDTVLGGTGDDLIFGAAGDDVLDGGAGDDTVWAGPGVDVIVFGAGDGDDLVHLGPDDDETLRLDAALWDGDLSEREVLSEFGLLSGADYRLDFGAETLTLADRAGMTQAELQALIEIV